MQEIRAQAKEMFPSVYLTLLSMIQALAVEALWSATNERPHLWVANGEAFVGWLQVTATLLMIFFIWVAFLFLVIRLRWVATIRDSAIPFVLGLAEFAMVGLIRPGVLHLWFYVAAGAAVFGAGSNWLLTRAASQEPENVGRIAAYGRGGWWGAYGPLLGWVGYGVTAGTAVLLWRDALGLRLALTAGANLLAVGLIAWTGDAWSRAIQRD